VPWRDRSRSGILARVYATGAPRKMCINAVLMLVVVAVLGACSSTSKAGRRETGHNPIPPTGALVGVGPSSATKMICESEAKKDIAQSGVGFDTIEPLRPRWAEASRIYSCDYIYGGGANVTLSVKQASSLAETTAYFDSLAERLGKTRSVFGTGEGAYATRDDDIVVRKGDKVLLVDVSKLPPRFGKPANTRNDVATAFAVIILGCWGSNGVVG
jgi:hypothetical protein